jgi:hypothetical protein
MAAKAAGVSKSTILRAIKSHRISAAKNDTGDWTLDPAELHPVFPPVRSGEERAGNGAAERGATADRRVVRGGGFAAPAVLADRDAWREQAQTGQRVLAPPDRTQRSRPCWRC